MDTAPLHFEGLRRALKHVGITLSESWYRERVGLSRHAFFDEVRRHFERDLDDDAMMAAHEAYYFRHVRDVETIEPVVDVVRAHRGLVPLAVASGGKRSHVDAALVSAGMDGLFDAVVTHEDVDRGKPAPDIFLEAARRLNVQPAVCVVYEDSDEGLEAAAEAGMRIVDVRTG